MAGFWRPLQAATGGSCPLPTSTQRDCTQQNRNNIIIILLMTHILSQLLHYILRFLQQFIVYYTPPTVYYYYQYIDIHVVGRLVIVPDSS